MNSLQKLKYLTYTISLLILLVTFITLTLHYYHTNRPQSETDFSSDILLDLEDTTPDSVLTFKPVQSKSCRFDNCFDITRCEFNHESLVKVYIYPPIEFYTEQNGVRTHLNFNTSLPYKDIISAIQNSAFYTEDPSRACVFIPPIDTLIDSTNDPQLTSLALSHLPFWNQGANHIVFSFLPSHPNSHPSLSTQRSVIAGAGLLYSQYRTGFDLSIPAYNYPERIASPPTNPTASHRDIYLLILLPLELDTSLETLLERIQVENSDRVVLLDFCHEEQRCVGEETVEYPAILLRAKFCLLITGYRYVTMDLLDVMMYGCVSAYLLSNHMLPFEEALDWRLIGVPIRPAFLPQTLSILDSLSEEEWRGKQTHSLAIWSRYFRSLGRIALTALLVLNERVFPVQASSYTDWNLLLDRKERRDNPLLMVPTPARDSDVTAIIASYGHVSHLTELVRVLTEMECVNRVLVVWRSHASTPTWTHARVSVIQSETIFLSLDEIQGECILTLSDDVTLSSDQIELGYQMWREFPDRLVGFSPATHRWNEVNKRWECISDVGNEFSLLTGPLFYHSYYHTLLSEHHREWMDRQHRCEEFTLNFLISIHTNKSPIKLSQNTHLCTDNCDEAANERKLNFEVRNECLNELVEYFGRMPLRSTSFRVDKLSQSVDMSHGN